MFSLICAWITVEYTIVRLVIWDAIVPIMTSLKCFLITRSDTPVITHYGKLWGVLQIQNMSTGSSNGFLPMITDYFPFDFRVWKCVIFNPVAIWSQLLNVYVHTVYKHPIISVEAAQWLLMVCCILGLRASVPGWSNKLAPKWWHFNFTVCYHKAIGWWVVRCMSVVRRL